MRFRRLCSAAIAPFVLAFLTFDRLSAQQYIEVAIESVALAGDFDSGVLGHVAVDEQFRGRSHAYAYARLPVPGPDVGRLRFVETRDGLSLFLRAQNHSTTSARTLEAHHRIFSPTSEVFVRFRDDTDDQYQGNTEQIDARHTIAPADLDGHAVGVLQGDWQLVFASEGDAVASWRIDSADGADVTVPATGGRRVRFSTIRDGAYPGGSDQLALAVTVDGTAVVHSGVVAIDARVDRFASVRMGAPADARLLGAPTIALLNAFVTSARPPIQRLHDALFVTPTVQVLELGPMTVSGVDVLTLPVFVLPLGISLTLQGVVVSDLATNGEFTASDALELRLTDQLGATRNSPPIADAGADQSVTAGDWVGLDASASRDVDAFQRPSVTWRQLTTSGAPSVTLAGADRPGAYFRAPLVTVPTALTFRVEIDDGSAVSFDDVTVTIAPATAEFGGALTLQPYRDALSEREARHLLRRAGLGGTEAEVAAARSGGLDQTIQRLVTIVPTPELFDAMRAITGTVRRPGDIWGQLDQRYRQAFVMAMVHSPNQLVERMAYFWHDFHATAMVNGAQGEEATIGRHLELLRRNWNPLPGDPAWQFDYRAHLLALARDGLMLRFLDGDSNVAADPNENFAREFFELYTLGEPEVSGTTSYNEFDVIQTSRAFTGWTMRATAQMSAAPLFRPQLHDAGNKTVFSITAPFDDAMIVDLVLTERRQLAAEFLARRLVDQLLGVELPQAEILTLAAQLSADGWEISGAVQRILRSEAMFAPATRLARIKNPVEFAVAFYRALQPDLQLGTAAGVDRAAELMGHLLFEPPSPAGWEDGMAWITEGSLAVRLSAMAQIGLSRDAAADTVSHTAAGTIALLARRLDVDPNDTDMHILVEFADTSIDLAGREVFAPFDQRARHAAKLQAIAALLANHPDFHRN